MKKWSTFFLLVAFSVNCSAAQWVLFAQESNDGERVQAYVEPSTIHSEAGWMTGWVSFRYSAPRARPAWNKTLVWISYDENSAEMAVKCDNRMLSERMSILSLKGRRVYFSQVATDWESAGPGIQEDIVERLCRRDLAVEQPVSTGSSAVAARAAVATPQASGTMVPPKLGKNSPQLEYPEVSRQLGEEGTPAVHVCIGPTGELSGEPSIKQSSGSARLDEGALKFAKAAHYEPGTEDGKPIEACFDFSIGFRLQH